jgi:hypothetical protein
MKTIKLNTAYPRGLDIKDQPVFADAGEELEVGVDITAAEAARMVENGGAEDITPKSAKSKPADA